MAKDPYRYFRIEARELQEGLTKGLLALEKGAARAETVAALLRLAHTLKGAARVVKVPRVSEFAHNLEETLGAYRDGNTAIPPDVVTSMLGVVDAIAMALSALEAPVLRKPAPPAPMVPVPAPALEEPLETVRINVSEMDGLLDGLAEAGAQLAALRRDSHALQRATKLSGAIYEQLSARSTASAQTLLNAEELRGQLGRLNENLSVGVEQLGTELSQLRDTATQLRLLPAEIIFPALERTARDAAQAQKKNVLFEAAGGETRLDAHVLAALRDAMLQVVRNAVAHGIEPEANRTAAGKTSAGSVRLSVERRGNRVAFICRDDGAGIDLGAVQRAAAQRGMLPEHAASVLTLDDAIQLLLKGGLTTAQTASEVAGRGIGLDLVRSTAARLKGTVAVKTEPGRGTTVEICVPISLASLAALRVEASGKTASIPLDAITRTLRITGADLAASNGSTTLLYDGRSLPYVTLAELLGGKAKAANGAAHSAVVVEFQQRVAALGVERLLGTENVVLRPMPPPIRAEEFILGASLDMDGNPELVMDPAGIVAAAGALRAEVRGNEAAQAKPVLVIDDSLTTRMLEQSILQSAGFEVELAVSAEDGLEKLRAGKFGMVVVDVEMPGMDGFQFVEQVQADSSLREVPCILVTSRNAPEDRQRGSKAGAKAYIVKSEFDQDFLVRTIRELMRL